MAVAEAEMRYTIILAKPLGPSMFAAQSLADQLETTVPQKHRS